VTSRTYLSIGDVLTLLREEFPDVTISKIRFLESQGLVNPERSPSGYRKFFDHDVERLRWVLRQQREHFLPLKVIRDRLADGELDDAGTDMGNGKSSEPAYAAAGAPATAQTQEQPTKADQEAMARILEDASRRAARLPEEVQTRRGLQVVAESETAATAAVEHSRDAAGSVAPPMRAHASQPTASAQPAASAHAGAARGTGVPRGAASKGARPANGASLPPRGEPAAAAARTGPPPPTEAKARRGATQAAGEAPRGGKSDPLSGMATGASLSLEELCAASGLTAEEVAGLEGFGLIDCVAVAGIATYDEDALTVANLAAAFRAFGVEPPPQRLYRNAVEREMGLIEQVVIPLLRQRNPESRQRAVEGAEQLAALGQSMRATLLHLSLRRHLGG
jgi:DNA-binding transcriptional MerR regulator